MTACKVWDYSYGCRSSNGGRFEIVAVEALRESRGTCRPSPGRRFAPLREMATSASKEARTNPNSNLAGVWDLRKLDTIVPNNQEIINAVENNTHLLSPAAKFAFVKFKAHAVAFEQNQYERLDNYPTFPEEFEKEFMNV